MTLSKPHTDDFEEIVKSYSRLDNDYGFTTVSEKEHQEKIGNATNLTKDQHQKHLLELEKLIIPFLVKLRDTGDKEYIYWPNRKPAIEKQIAEILKYTRVWSENGIQ